MTKNAGFRRAPIAIALAATAALALPVSAALWPQAQGHSIDLSRFDAITRTGEAALATDPYCDTPDVVDISLSEDFAERISMSALNPDGTRMDFWSSDLMGTWTLTYTRADGIMCVVTSGTGWSVGSSPTAFMRDAGMAI